MDPCASLDGSVLDFPPFRILNLFRIWSFGFRICCDFGFLRFQGKGAGSSNWFRPRRVRSLLGSAGNDAARAKL